ncbi:MAG: phenylalanine--tRNA ligase subunit alpha [Bacilli bacterium]|nr:phenylalanine--tRNA ligase subunit alpha [Bacilli bacterium]NLN80721.1 phenylalanine--tRNA ligase subunit alpha [Erysipelotrichia bacterium]
MKEHLEKLDHLLKLITNKIEEAISKKQLIEIRNAYLSKKAEINTMLSILKSLTPEERSVFGQKINSVREHLFQLYEQKSNLIDRADLTDKLNKEQIDLSLPSVNYTSGGVNPVFLVRDEILNIFIEMGYEVKEGRDVESDYYNFELMNIPKNHPSRDMQDSFYFSESLLLRTHTSPAQARVMEEKKGELIKVVCPGKCYRRDNDDMTHSHQFMQIEGLLVGQNINLGHLKATLDLFIKKMFGPKREIRLVSSYFPFTEPSVEVEVSCAECDGQGCPTCKHTGYIEILGAGMVHPDVLKMSGYDPEIYSGFAFGIGVERVAMLRYQIDDIRRIYQNDVRFLKQFK